MWSFSLILLDIGYHLYTYGFIFIIILIIWQLRQSYCGLKYDRKRSCCRRHRKVRQRARDAASRARRLSQEEAEKPWDLLSIMKSQDWLPQEEGVRRLLCADPSCQTCNAVTLEIQQLLEGEANHVSPALLEPPQGSSCTGMLSVAGVSFKQDVDFQYQQSTDLLGASVTPMETQQTECLTQPTNAVNVQECWFDHVSERHQFHLADMPIEPEAVAFSRFEGPAVPVNEQEMVQSSPYLVQRNEDRQSLNFPPVFLPQNSENTNLMPPVALQIIPYAHLPFLSHEVLRLLEIHMKKWMHFQRWGLPRRVEESLRQFMPNPSICYQPENNQQLSFVLNNTSDLCVNRFGTISHNTWCSYMAGQPTQTFWVSEWPLMSVGQRHFCQQIQNSKALAMPSPAADVPSGLYPLPGGQADDSQSNLQQQYSQLFCGPPSLHSESLFSHFWGSQGFSQIKTIPTLPSRDPLLLEALSSPPPRPGTPREATPRSPSACPPCLSPSEQPRAQIGVPFLTPAECEALEWHLLQRQLQLQWGLPAVSQRALHARSHTWCEPATREPAKTCWPGKPFSFLTRELLFFPEHARRLLDFHLQRQLIYHRWGLPPRIQQSMQLLLSTTDRQALSWTSRRPAALEASGAGDLQVPIPVPHLLAQAKAMLHGHIDSKCGQIHQGKVPACVYSSWECRAAGGQAVAAFPRIPQSQLLKAASDPALQCRARPWTPAALGAQPRALPGAGTERPKVPRFLSKTTIEKLETVLRHKYLIFLSGLPALYYVALSRSMGPAVTRKPGSSDSVPRPIRIKQEPRTQPISPDNPPRVPGPWAQDDNKTYADRGQDFPPAVQLEDRVEMVPLESQAVSASPCSFKTPRSTKLNFHLRKKSLEIKLGISVRARESKEPTDAVSGTKSTREPLGSVNCPGDLGFWEPPILPYSTLAPDSELVHLKGQQSTELKAMKLKQKPAASKAMPHAPVPHAAGPHDGAPWASKVPRLSGDTREARVLCVQLEAGRHGLGLEPPWSPEPQSPAKGQDSAPVPTLADKTEDPGKARAAGDLGEGDAGLGHPSACQEARPAEDQRPEGMLLSRVPRGSRRRSHGSQPGGPRPHSPLRHPPVQLPEPPPGGPEGQGPGSAPPAAPPASAPQQVEGPTSQGTLAQGQVAPAHSHRKPYPPESCLRSKMKSLLHCINPVPKDKGHAEPTVSTAKKVAKSRKQDVEKSPAPAKSPTEKTKSERPARPPRAQAVPVEKPAGLALSEVPRSPDTKLRLRSRQHSSASVAGPSRHCPRHCPRVACATQPGNSP